VVQVEVGQQAQINLPYLPGELKVELVQKFDKERRNRETN